MKKKRSRKRLLYAHKRDPRFPKVPAIAEHDEKVRERLKERAAR